MSDIKKQPAIRPAITWEQHQMLLRYLSANKNMRWLWWETACRVAWATGFQISDVALLAWSEVDLGTRIITLLPRETSRFHKVVTIPTEPELHEFLVYLREHPLREWHLRCKYVMPELKGMYESPARPNIARQFRWICARAGINNEISFQSYRHAFISRLVDSGASLFVIALMMRTTMKTLMTYAPVSMVVNREELEKARELLNEIRHKPVPTPPPLA